MACSGTYCNAYGTGTTTCVNHRDTCATNRPLSVSGSFGTAGAVVYASDIENLRANMMNEMDVWNNWYNSNAPASAKAKYDPGYRGAGYGINHNDIEYLRATIAQLNDPGIGVTYGGYTISAYNWGRIRASYDAVRQDCICNSDCACNAVCSCHNDCACNYSDERLKENIVFLETKSGLNLDSFTYLWDKTKTYIGVMAQEILNTKYAHAVITDKNGYYMVDYSKLPI